MRDIPNLQDLYNDYLADLQNSYGVIIASFGKVWLRALAAVQSGKLYQFYLGLANVQKNIFVDTCDQAELPRWGLVKLNRNPFAARAGQYTATVTGTLGATIPAQTTFKSDDTSTSPGFLFVLDAAYTMPGTTGTITLRALTAGTDAALLVADTLTATAPIAGVDFGATVSAITLQAAAAEDLEQYRALILQAFRLEAQGGARSDYRLWSANAQGVQSVYPYARSGEPWAVDLYVEATTADSTDGKGTPSALLLADVEAVVEFDPDTTKTLYERGRRPLGAIVYVAAITPLDIDINIVNYQGRTAAIEAAITASITSTVNAVRPFLAGSDILADQNDQLDNNKIVAAIFNARPGSIFNTVELRVNGVLVPSYTFINGNIPYLNSVNFV